MTLSAWGSDATQLFFSLTPERVLTAIESHGFRCTGRCLALNSYENRVYEVEIELEDDSAATTEKHLYANKRVIKFYRPGRWNRDQILEEHRFLQDLEAVEIPVVAPLQFAGETLFVEKESQIYYAIYAKFSGRAPDELQIDQLTQVGRLLGRIHRVGASRAAEHRIKLNGATYGRANVEFLLAQNFVPEDLRENYRQLTSEICALADQELPKHPVQRIHGDCHLGNLLWNARGPFFLDFDDMVVGPCVQDLWLALPFRGAENQEKRDALLDGYAQMHEWNPASLRIVEILRALRMIHFSAWIARRWEDPAFPSAFPEFGSQKYWSSQIIDLREQLGWIRHDLA